MILRIFNKLFKETFDTDYPLKSFAKINLKEDNLNSKLLLYKIVNPFSIFSSKGFRVEIYSNNFFNEMLKYNIPILLIKKTLRDYILVIFTKHGKVEIKFTHNTITDTVNIDIENSKNIFALSNVFLSLYFHHNNFRIVGDKNEITKWIYFISENVNLNTSILSFCYVNLERCNFIKINDVKNPNNTGIGSLRFTFIHESSKTDTFSINYYSSKMKLMIVYYFTHMLKFLDKICDDYELYKKENKYFERKLKENYY
ncbi:MAG: hypothetical protein QXX12_01380 [Nanopusillaceae archaeon]